MKSIDEYKTRCCNAKWIRKGRADYRCSKCGADVTLELVLLQEALDKSKKCKVKSSKSVK